MGEKKLLIDSDVLFGSGDYKALVLLTGSDLASSVAVATISSGGVAAVALIVFDS